VTKKISEELLILVTNKAIVWHDENSVLLLTKCHIPEDMQADVENTEPNSLEAVLNMMKIF
jgi:hypothetical protein